MSSSLVSHLSQTEAQPRSQARSSELKYHWHWLWELAMGVLKSYTRADFGYFFLCLVKSSRTCLCEKPCNRHCTAQSDIFSRNCFIFCNMFVQFAKLGPHFLHNFLRHCITILLKFEILGSLVALAILYRYDALLYAMTALHKLALSLSPFFVSIFMGQEMTDISHLAEQSAREAARNTRSVAWNGGTTQPGVGDLNNRAQI